jgi:hypothetical protein
MALTIRLSSFDRLNEGLESARRGELGPWRYISGTATFAGRAGPLRARPDGRGGSPARRARGGPEAGERAGGPARRAGALAAAGAPKPRGLSSGPARAILPYGGPSSRLGSRRAGAGGSSSATRRVA